MKLELVVNEENFIKTIKNIKANINFECDLETFLTFVIEEYFENYGYEEVANEQELLEKIKKTIDKLK